jgi:hypothetical protein
MLFTIMNRILILSFVWLQGGKQNYSRLREVEANNTSGPVGSNSFTTSPSQPPSQFAEAASPNSAQTAELEDTESGTTVSCFRAQVN